jgi:hypothetical protein
MFHSPSIFILAGILLFQVFSFSRNGGAMRASAKACIGIVARFA